MKKIILYNSIVFLVLLVVAELILWLMPVEDPYKKFKQYVEPGYIKSQFAPNTRLEFEMEDSLPGFENYAKKTVFSTNNIGFRGKELDIHNKSAYRILCVGGSTTECLRLNDGDDWPAVLESLLHKNSQRKYEVQNCGKSGEDLNDHISMIAHRIIHLKPDMIILYSGVNDLRKSYFDHNPLKIETQNVHTLPFSKLLLSQFQLYRRFYYMMKNQQAPKQESITLKSNYKGEVLAAEKAPISGTPAPLDTSYYAHKIKAIIGICKANNITLVIATQKTNWLTRDKVLNNWIYMNMIGDTAYSRTMLQQKMDEMNTIQATLAKQQGVYILRTDSLLPATAEYFHDDCHFNPKGCRQMAQHCFDLIQQINH
jgi:hypothetical protein